MALFAIFYKNNFLRSKIFLLKIRFFFILGVLSRLSAVYFAVLKHVLGNKMVRKSAFKR